MRPLLKISHLTNLQDARSSAAVGFDLIGFDLVRGSHRKLATPMVWNIVKWLSGPRIVVELSRDSLPELAEVQKSVEVSFATFPLADWGEDLLQVGIPIILRVPSQTDIDALIELRNYKGVYFELEMPSVEEMSGTEARMALLSIMDKSFLHFRTMEEGQEFIVHSDHVPYGFALGEEAEEEPGVLHYEKIDDWLETFEHRFPQS
ncbi:MAG: hypothetical protein AAFR59_18380 [Bacteroidota bacterium]